jgi:hypothetical protein
MRTLVSSFLRQKGVELSQEMTQEVSPGHYGNVRAHGRELSWVGEGSQAGGRKEQPGAGLSRNLFTIENRVTGRELSGIPRLCSWLCHLLACRCKLGQVASVYAGGRFGELIDNTLPVLAFILILQLEQVILPL